MAKPQETPLMVQKHAHKISPEPVVGWVLYDDYLSEKLLKLIGKGEAELLFVIRKNGRPSNVKIISSSVVIPPDSLTKIIKNGPVF
jgi:hypothetical protein